MNNYKFRGKTADGMWVYGYLMGKDKIAPCELDLTENGFTDKIEFVKPETVGQWTGLKDKNGNDVFCGDLVKDKDGTVYQIIFNAELARFCLKFSVGKNIGFTSFDRLNKLSAYDNIGNIFDNPELLEEK